MDDSERLMECVLCKHLQFCEVVDSEWDDENGHCTRFKLASINDIFKPTSINDINNEDEGAEE